MDQSAQGPKDPQSANMPQTPATNGSPFDMSQPPQTPPPSENSPVTVDPTPTDTATPPFNTVTTAPPPETPKAGSKKIIAGVLGVLLLVTGVISGVVIIRNQTLGGAKAWDCSLYTFSVNQSGAVTVQNNSNRNEPPQQAKVYINNNLVETFQVPALSQGDSATLGTVTVPNSPFSWRVEGTADCENSSNATPEISASCEAVKAYDTEGNLLSQSELSSQQTGDVIRFAVKGSASSGSFDKARFTINGTSVGEVSAANAQGEFYYDYTVPENVYSFNVTGQVHHSGINEWF